ncbi:GNAT family N-acetyltransferase [Shewanella olleyana]|uniref:GNAT family N-acetyltransferase n=1 Tax=Shewanella olleyana TaxID=135626 RepID=UPI00200CFD0E|nr:GNAT family N-acetyltransferase [Shewanella olleyana]MCL1065941.1 GNAT family N-acetyltransferase [Shewanella olleyana]
MLTAEWFYPAKLPLDNKSDDQFLDAQKQWSAVKQFYRQHLSYSKPNLNDKLALIRNETSPLAASASIDKKIERKAEIAAAIRIKTIGKCQLVTGLVVSQHFRGGGLAHQLMDFIKPSLLTQPSYVFAIPELKSFYQSHGFTLNQNIDHDIQQQFLKYLHKDKVTGKDKPLILMKLTA